MRIASLFSGTGGLELGMAEAGHATTLLCEIWPAARAVLEHRFSGVPIVEDVAGLSALPAGIEVLTAGFPCQDLSQAGRTQGIGGARSGLVEHVFRLVDRSRVPLVLLENVPFMLALERGRAMQRLTQAFEQRGYRWAYRVVDSLAFLPQRRRRVFMLASCCDLAPEDVLSADDAVLARPATRLDTHAHGFYWTEGTRGLGWAADAVPTLKNGSTVGIPSPPAILMPDGTVITPAIEDAERLQGFPGGWTAAAAARLRWSLVGNAVTVPVAAWVGGRLATPGCYDVARDRIWPAGVGTFPAAARFDGVRRHRVEVGEHPVSVERPPLHAFLRHAGKPLSERATRGFLARARASTLRFAPGFLERVEAHLARAEPIKRAAA